jgi:hypothetical protein
MLTPVFKPWRLFTGHSTRRPCDICGGQSDTGSTFLRVLRFSPVSIISPTFHSHLHLHAALTRRTNGSGNHSKSSALSGIRERWIEKYFHLASVFKGLNIETNKRSEITGIPNETRLHVVIAAMIQPFVCS